MSDSSASADPPPSLQQQIDTICDRFEAALKVGPAVKIEDFLVSLAGDDSHQLLKGLVAREIQHRQEQGDTVTPADYQQRFGNAIGDIESLLFFPEDESTVELVPQAAQAAAVVRGYQPSREIGPYKLLQSLGRGGMGEVWMADQQKPVKRRVALKLIKSGMASKQVIALFEAERQALAMMDHPHIAKVLDAGVTEDGAPYFAMELVLGKPITKYCDRARLGINERLELFVQVCRAIQHAHQKGILHRDIKPNNVLVAQRDGVPHAKVIDFGLAKAVQEKNRLTDQALRTQAGQVFGTPTYMSPEQAESSGLALDTRTDVYSLGVLLFELMTGSTPITRDRVKRESFQQVLASITNEDAPRPSRRLSESGDAATGISEHRKVEPQKLMKLLKGELDWIALKALEKDRERRYEGAGSLAADVQHYLDGDIVEARPPSAGYRFRKMVWKHKTAFATGTAFMLLLVAALVFNVGVAQYALDEASRANAEARRATAAQVAAEKALHKQIVAERQAIEEIDKTANGLFELLAGSSTPEQFRSGCASIQRTHVDGVVRLAEQELDQQTNNGVSPEKAEVLARRQSNAAILLLKLGQPQSVWPLLKHSPNPTVRSYIVNWFGPRGGDANTIIARYEQESDVSIQRALLLCLGAFPESVLSGPGVEQFTDNLLTVYRTDPDSGLHAAAEWLLRRWGASNELAVIDEQLAQTVSQIVSTEDNAREWFINSQRQTFVVLEAGEFLMGSDEREANHRRDEVLHCRVIHRRFAIGTKEVTGGQWRAFSSQVVRAGGESDSDDSPDDSPVAKVSWYDAAWYCNWLSEQEGIPEGQWCYEPNADGVYGAGMKARDQFWELDGYRLPTESEWEYACRAGSLTSRYYGNTHDLLSDYAWYADNAGNQTHPVGVLKPNDFGLYDTLGNVWEWCDDWYGVYPPGPVNDRTRPSFGLARAFRGGCWFDFAGYCRSASRLNSPPVNHISRLGFRVCLNFAGVTSK